jgi:diaminopimelate epimerase
MSAGRAIAFAKLQGAGNDFVLIDGRTTPARDDAAWARLARALSERRFGVGSDGLLLVSPSGKADVRMRMWNPDGSQAQMCGNGLRCFARYLFDRELQHRGVLSVETDAGLRTARLRDDRERIEVSMGRPVVYDAALPVPGLGPDLTHVTHISMGNPHAVHFVTDVEGFDLATVGPKVERHPLFPERINFHVCEVHSPTELAMRTWERGAGLTLACGTGACATAVAAQVHGLTASTVAMRVPGGQLELCWDGQGEVLLTGEAREVFVGEWPEG